ncbi:uncharacterized protein Z518_01140 [Rhinocladiella mackenziei CBS 650.93]|uniref:Rhinocladiella mackenziei CBS 650.93 unplaced genomic scaffold supercont1.1, whole genome shotgun sequence n=1 Tax=Rhinocladiella mackenziei CBS 650.93 TaxID=1442369 RepID=A0A0D2IVK2_9EURO|nr:uncharacterized protein Z518_01140 [Rhinocladiella mackenziei CBS 650.93]KIX10059.1 hypothetical protein Z518_01140 [Rhinocladiella mackenziei CBS 650.93]
MDKTTVLRTTTLLGLGSAIYLSGINFSASHLTLPILYRLPKDTSTSAFAELYSRGAYTVVPLAIFSTLCTGASAYLDPEKRVGYAIAAGLTFATLPWTQFAMMETNKNLIKISEETTVSEKKSDGEVERMLRQWKWMNMVRAALAAVGAVLGFVVAVERV